MRSFLFTERNRREIALAPYAIMNKRVPLVQSPYLDHDLYEFLTSLDMEDVFKDDVFRREVIARAYPEYADIPYAQKREEKKQEYHLEKIKFSKDIAKYYINPRTVTSGFLNNRELFPRALRMLMDHGYCKRSSWLFNPRIIYLAELGKLIKEGL